MPTRRPTVRSMLYVAVLLATVATFGVYRALQAMRLEAEPVKRAVVVADRDIPEGVAITRSDVTLLSWPVPTVPEAAFTRVDSVIGRVTRGTIYRGEAVVLPRLAPIGADPGLAVKITPGHRAMAVKINDVAGISGLIQPNSRVDVLVTLHTDNRENQVAKVFMENVRVLSVGTTVHGTDGKPIDASTATLEVTPQGAERLALAMNEGSIQLVLRGYGDPDSVTTPGASAADVLSQLRTARAVVPAEEPPPRKKAPPPRHIAAPPPARTTPQRAQPTPRDSTVVRVYRGDKITQQTFQKNDTSRKHIEP